MLTMTGAVGADDWALITTLAEGPDAHPSEFATVKVYIPAVRPDIVALVPVPAVITPPGLRVNVQTPVAGKPLSSALPVGNRHDGWVIAPI
jgi:multidrug efflux pump subunit AcrA (membrane-fusion protein)